MSPHTPTRRRQLAHAALRWIPVVLTFPVLGALVVTGQLDPAVLAAVAGALVVAVCVGYLRRAR